MVQDGILFVATGPLSTAKEQSIFLTGGLDSMHIIYPGKNNTRISSRLYSVKNYYNSIFTITSSFVLKEYQGLFRLTLTGFLITKEHSIICNGKNFPSASVMKSLKKT